MPTADHQEFLEELQGLRGIDQLLAVTAKLRHPTQGCPWDLKQTHRSLRRFMLEEAYESVEAMTSIQDLSGQNGLDEAIEVAHFNALKEELGDVLLQVALHSRLAEEAKQFDFNDVCQTLSEKLIRRHPHVFAPNENANIQTEGDVNQQWAAIKQAEKLAASAVGQHSNGTGAKEKKPIGSILTDVPKSQPALSRALETSKRAVKVGFAWPDLDSLWACVMSEFDEFRAELPPDAFSHNALSSTTQDRLESEMGDILFATVNLARQFNIDPEVALTRATEKFTKRFQGMENVIENKSLNMQSLTFSQWDELWNLSKQNQFE
jgi:MazG family protein